MAETYQYSVRLRGLMKGHTNWVTSLATTPESNDMVLSGSRDKSIIIWDLKSGDNNSYALPKRALRGHSHYVQDVVISSDGQFALSGSWDATLRLWDLNTGMTTRPTFVGHSKDVLSVAFSSDNRQIVSGSRDRTIKLWNTLGDCKYTLEEQRHNDWVSCVRFSPVMTSPLSPETAMPLFVSGGWDKTVKVWNLQRLKLLTNLHGHTGYINTVTVSPDGSLCASGGKDQTAMLWDLTEGKHLYSLDAGSIINSLVFSPNRYWLCAATDDGVKIWDLESKSVVASLTASVPDFFPSSGAAGRTAPQAISLAWSADGNTLFAGYTDGIIRVWTV